MAKFCFLGGEVVSLFMAQGKKLLMSLVECDLIDLKSCPEDNKSNKRWAGCEGLFHLENILLSY